MSLSHTAVFDRADVLLAGILLWPFQAVLEVDSFHEDESDNWNNLAILFQINVTFKTRGEIVLRVVEFVLFYFFISLSQGRLEERHLVILFSSLVELFRICQTRVPMC